VIVALWRRWTGDGSRWWLAFLLAVVLLDAFVGSWIIAHEIRLLQALR